VVTNVSATAETDPQRLQQLLIEQMTAPVRWTDAVKAVVGTGVTGAYEVGPGAVLKGLVRRIDRALEVRSMGTAQELAELGPEVTGA
jgi:[acyl-carrier-protein] S-malonyltransferase